MSTYGNNLLAQYYAQQEALPNEYRRVEYIESHKTQYVDSCLQATGSSYVMCDIMLLNLELYANRILGNYNNNAKSYTINCAWETGVQVVNISRFGALNSGRLDAIKFPLNTRHTVGNNKYGIIADGVVVHQWEAEQSFTTVGNVALLASSNASGAVPSTLNNGLYGRCYGIKWKENGVLIRNFIPCVRKSDGKPGLFDFCKSICPLTGTPFYINSGTGEFVTP